MQKFTAPLLICATLALSACNSAAFRRESGDMDQGDFGNATMQNTMIASGQVQAPMGHDKYDAPSGNRRLNGKYAANLYKGYLSTAERVHPANTAIITQTNPAGG
jgi:hypothetical protein